MLTIVKEEVMHSVIENLMTNDDSQSIPELYKEMIQQQPCLGTLLQIALNLDNSNDWKDGYCKGLFQTWYLLNQQSIIDDLEDNE